MNYQIISDNNKQKKYHGNTSSQPKIFQHTKHISFPLPIWSRRLTLLFCVQATTQKRWKFAVNSCIVIAFTRFTDIQRDDDFFFVPERAIMQGNNNKNWKKN